jgi:hypothetical protein
LLVAIAGTLLLAAATGAPAPAKAARVPAEPAPDRTVTIAAGPEYAAGRMRTRWLGQGYRELWTTPVTVPVLDLATFAGGLTPVRRIGRLQTPGLAFAGRDGRSYTFRSLHKEPERVLPVEWRESFPAKIVRDHTSALHPGAALLLPALAEALSVLHTEPRLVLLPDDPALGVFRDDFGGQLGTLDLYPSAGPGVPPFEGTAELVTSVELWERWLEGAGGVDARAFLRARILDLLVGNYDRHAGQWRWARRPDRPLWLPLPEDPDMAFIRNEGLAFDLLRGRAPKFVRFEEEFPGRLEGMTLSGSELDRWLLSSLDRVAFQEAAREAQGRLTDAVIAEALSRLPADWRMACEARLAPALRSRREKLVEHVLHHYRDLAAKVDVHATDHDEVVTVRRLATDGLEIAVTEATEAPGAGRPEPWFRRVFVPGETGEVRVFLHGGDDRVVRTGKAGGPIRVRVVAGAGRDVVDDSRSGGTEAWPDGGGPDGGELEVLPGPGTRRRGAWTNPEPDPEKPWAEPRDFGRWTVPFTQVMYATELDLLVGVGLARTAWGFRSRPEASRQDASFLWSTGEQRGRFAYAGTFRRPGSRAALRLEALGSGIERTNFFGSGNETEKPESKQEYRTLESFLALTPSLRLERSRELQLRAGPTLRLSDTPTDRPNVLNRNEAYGRGRFAEAGLRAGIHYDTRGLEERLLSGGLFETVATGPARRADLRAEADAFYFPPLLDVEEAFYGIEAELAGYLGRSRSRVQLAARVGGRRVWGRYPWFESAFVGGRASLRGYSRQRFAGDASLYGGVEARAWLVTVDVPPVPLRLGVLAFADAGRVWLSGEESDRWHTSWGAGLMLQPVATPFVLTAAWARGREDTRFYFGYGFFF